MASIIQPGIQIQQTLATVTPTIYSPTFPACIVGPCYQIVEIQAASGAVNASANLTLPPIIINTAGVAASTYAVGGLSVTVDVSGTVRTYTFGGAAAAVLPIATVVSKLNEGFASYLVWDYIGNRIRVRTVGTGATATMMFTTAGTAHSVLGFLEFENLKYYGSGDYDSNPIAFPYKSLPDPRGIIDYLVFDDDDIDIARVWAGVPILLSSESCINRNRYQRLGVVADGGNGAGKAAKTYSSQGGREFYFLSGHVRDVGDTVNLVGAQPLWNATPLTGNKVDLNAVPNNQLLHPVADGTSTTNQLQQTGRHAYVDVQLSDDGVTTTASYHFEAHGFQAWLEDQTLNPGQARYVFGNEVYVSFTSPDLDGAGDPVLADGVISAGDQLDSITVNGGGGFVVAHENRYVFLEAGTDGGPVTYDTWYIIDSTAAGTATLTDLAGGAVVLTAATSINFTISSGLFTLPNVAAPVNAAGEVHIAIEYCPGVAADWDVTPSFVQAAALHTALGANTNVEPWLGASTTVGASTISYLSGATTALLADQLDGKTYYMSFGADPSDLDTTATGFPTITGESPLTAGTLAAIEGKTLTMRINGGVTASHTFTAVDTGGLVAFVAALNTNLASVLAGAAVTPFSDRPISDWCTGTEYYSGGTASVNGATLTITGVSDAVFTAAGTDHNTAQMSVLLYGTGIPGGTKGAIVPITAGGANCASTGGTATINLSQAVTSGAVSCSYKLLVNSASTVVRLTMDTATSVGGYVGYDCSVEFGGNAVDYVFKAPYSSSTTPFTGIFRGPPTVVQAGDKLYNNAAYLGTVATIADHVWVDPVTNTTHTASGAYLNTAEATISASTSLGAWYITSENITYSAATSGLTASGKPLPEVWFDTTNQIIYLKGGLNRDGGGVEYSNSSASLAAGYTALRKDITVSGASPAPQVFSTYSELNTLLGPVDSRNPLALGTYIAMLNAPNIQVKAFGVDAVSANQPWGTSAAYATALDYLQSADVYAIVCLSNSPAVHELANAHVTAMADPTTGKSERVTYFCEDQPSEQVPTTAGSAPATDAPTITMGSSFELTIDPSTGFNIAAALTGKTDATGAAVPILGACTIANGLYITRAGDPFKYSVSEIKAGNVLECRVTGFSPGSGPGTAGNDDNFYGTADPGSTADSPTWDVDGETVTLFIRQAALVTTTSTGRGQLAAALAAKAGNYDYRRTRFVQPAAATYLEAGVSTSIHGLYACAALAGLNSSTAPQQSFTGLTLAGIESVSGSWDLLSANDMDTAAGGGVWWLFQADQYSAVETRHQLTTDVASIQVREASITHVLDYITKRLRVTMDGLAGNKNLTPNFLDYIGIMVNTITKSLVGTVVAQIQVTNIYIDPLAVDTLYVDLSVTPYYPANQIKVTLVV